MPRWAVARASRLRHVRGPVYRALFRVLLMRLPAERAHRVVFALLRLVAALPGVRALLRRWLAPRAPELRVQAFGLELPGPVGLAAGFDKDARGYEALGALGFGFVEVGTLTPVAQAGQPAAPDVALARGPGPAQPAGLQQPGARRRRPPGLDRPRQVLVGVNIGKARVTPPEQAVADYVRAAETLGHLADYLVVNVSSPNTPGLRALQQIETLRGLLQAVRAALARVAPRRDASPCW